MTAPLRNHGKLQTAWDRECLNKVRFTNEYVARARVQQLLQRGVLPRDRFWVYQCPNCRGWHMTSTGYVGGWQPSITRDDLFAEGRAKSRAVQQEGHMANKNGKAPGKSKPSGKAKFVPFTKGKQPAMKKGKC